MEAAGERLGMSVELVGGQRLGQHIGDVVVGIDVPKRDGAGLDVLVDEVESDCHVSRAPSELVLGGESYGCSVVRHENGWFFLRKVELCEEATEPDDLAQGELDRFDLRVGRREGHGSVTSGAGTDGAAGEVEEEREAELGLGVAVLNVRRVGHAP